MAIASAAVQLKGFIAKFDPEHQVLLRAVRRAMRKRLPGAFELVYDNYNFFVIGYSPTERPSDAIASIVGGPNGVSLCLIHGARLPDPDRRMSGGGTQTRFVRLPSADTLADPAIDALLTAAEARGGVPFRAAARGTLIIRSISAKQRPRRAKSKR